MPLGTACIAEEASARYSWYIEGNVGLLDGAFVHGYDVGSEAGYAVGTGSDDASGVDVRVWVEVVMAADCY